MSHRLHLPLCLCLAAATVWSGCGGEGEIKPDDTPIVGVLELPFAHRNGGSEPTDASRVEIGPSEIRVDGETALPLDKGKVPPGEQSGYVLPKLKAKLGSKRSIAISVHAITPYATLARVIQTGFDAGAKELAFRVRKPNTTKDTGWLVIKQSHFTESPDNSKFAETELLPWESFTKVWEESLDACQGSSRGDCGYRPLAKAEGGKLDMMLRVRGSGLALRMRQSGVAEAAKPEEGAEKAAEKVAEKPKPKAKPKAKRAEMLDGIKAAPVAEETPPEPSTEHVFTLRSDQATVTPSPVTGIVKPVCGSQSCPIVFDAEGISITANVLALLGAAFPDGTPEPKVAWVLPPAKAL